MTHLSKPNPLATYAEAITQIENAVVELDQAHATLRDIGCEHYNYNSARSGNRRSIRQIHDDAVALLASIQQLGCDSCGRPVNAHVAGECEEWSN